MRLVVKRDDEVVNELQFASGPINIGRDADCQVFLSDRTVSRHHATIYFDAKALKWMIKDQGSTNKTRLNDKAVEKSEIKTGDVLRITSFAIQVSLEDDTIADEPINLEDTLAKTAYNMDSAPSKASTGTQAKPVRSPLDPETMIRRLDSKSGPDITMPFKRVRDFVQATEAICKADGLDEVLQALLDIARRQFGPFHVWCALRDAPAGPMMSHAGKQRDGRNVEFSEIVVNEKITEAIDKQQFVLMPRIPHQRHQQEKDRVNSAMIAPIMGGTGCFGVLYVDNPMDHKRYTLADLDYLIMLAIHTSVIIENF